MKKIELKRKLKFILKHLDRFYYRLVLIIKFGFSNKNGNRIILLNTPIHGNLGDQAITIAELFFFNKYFPGITLIEVNEKLWSYEQMRIIQRININDLILIHGGGYLGSIWRSVAESAMKMISSFPDNYKIILPQTAYYSNLDQDIMMSDSLFYKNQNKLYFCARDKSTYNILVDKQNVEESRVFFVPDIVTSMKYTKVSKKRKGVLFILRTDKEKTSKDDVIKTLIIKLKKEGIKFTVSDTIYKYFIPFLRKRIVYQKLKEFSKYEIVITDRLHGMYFSAISSTPCIAMNNISKKVEGGFFWIKDLGYIKLSDNEDLIYNQVNELRNIVVNEYDNTHQLKNFENLVKLLKKILNN
jgi:exopolysaccharide biosynthesis predicted pyruvyltransferase EpsI